MKKIIKIGIVILMIIMSIVGVVIYKWNDIWESKFEQTSTDGKWWGWTISIKYENNDTIIKIAGASRRIDINNTKWQILTSSEKVILEGEVYDIYDYGKTGSFANDVSHSRGGYMKTDEGENITNSTIYWENYATKCERTDYPDNSGKAVIIFMNKDESSESNWKLSAEDSFVIRVPQNYPSEFDGEKIESGYILKLIYKSNNEQIGNVVIQ